jgi:hypothetical protein
LKSSIEEKAEKREMARVLIATPTAAGTVKSLYVTTLLKAVLAVKDAGWNPEFVSFDSSYISRARNYFANQVLRHADFSHLVMIDSDMSFERHIIPRMLKSGKPVVAAAYSQRRIDLDAFAQTARDPNLSMTEIAAAALSYNLQPEPEPGSRQVRVIDGMCRVHHVALGCSVIGRDALEAMTAAGVVKLRPDRFLQKSGIEGPFYDFFDEITLEDGDIVSEDYSFCKRWRSIPGNEIWAVIDEPIGHVGDMVYVAPYLNRLLKGKA